MTPDHRALRYPRPQLCPYLVAATRRLRGVEPRCFDAPLALAQARDAEDEALRFLLRGARRVASDEASDLWSSVEVASGRLDLTGDLEVYWTDHGAVRGALALPLAAGTHLVVSTDAWRRARGADACLALVGFALGLAQIAAWERGAALIAWRLLDGAARRGGGAPYVARTRERFGHALQASQDRAALRASQSIPATLEAVLATACDAPPIVADALLVRLHGPEDAPIPEADSLPASVLRRGRALLAWSEGREDDPSAPREPELGQLDLLGQAWLQALTTDLLAALFAPPAEWPSAARAHAGLFCEQPWESSGAEPWPDPRHQLGRAITESVADYLLAVLLDVLAFGDVRRRDDGDPRLDRALRVARGLGLDAKLADLIHRELGVGRARLKALQRSAAEGAA